MDNSLHRLRPEVLNNYSTSNSEFARILNTIQNQGFLKIENSEEYSQSPDLDSEITYTLGFGSKF